MIAAVVDKATSFSSFFSSIRYRPAFAWQRGTVDDVIVFVVAATTVMMTTARPTVIAIIVVIVVN